jgi:hypothetical protein
MFDPKNIGSKENDDHLWAPDIKKFKILGVIGQGSSGFVEKAIYEPKNQLIALKVNFCFFKFFNHSPFYIFQKNL